MPVTLSDSGSQGGAAPYAGPFTIDVPSGVSDEDFFLSTFYLDAASISSPGLAGREPLNVSDDPDALCVLYGTGVTGSSVTVTGHDVPPDRWWSSRIATGWSGVDPSATVWGELSDIDYWNPLTVPGITLTRDGSMVLAIGRFSGRITAGPPEGWTTIQTNPWNAIYARAYDAGPTGDITWPRDGYSPGRIMLVGLQPVEDGPGTRPFQRGSGIGRSAAGSGFTINRPTGLVSTDHSVITLLAWGATSDPGFSAPGFSVAASYVVGGSWSTTLVGTGHTGGGTFDVSATTPPGWMEGTCTSWGGVDSFVVGSPRVEQADGSGTADLPGVAINAESVVLCCGITDQDAAIPAGFSYVAQSGYCKQSAADFNADTGNLAVSWTGGVEFGLVLVGLRGEAESRPVIGRRHLTSLVSRFRRGKNIVGVRFGRPPPEPSAITMKAAHTFDGSGVAATKTIQVPNLVPSDVVIVSCWSQQIDSGDLTVSHPDFTQIGGRPADTGSLIVREWTQGPHIVLVGTGLTTDHIGDITFTMSGPDVPTVQLGGGTATVWEGVDPEAVILGDPVTDDWPWSNPAADAYTVPGITFTRPGSTLLLAGMQERVNPGDETLPAGFTETAYQPYMTVATHDAEWPAGDTGNFTATTFQNQGACYALRLIGLQPLADLDAPLFSFSDDFTGTGALVGWTTGGFATASRVSDQGVWPDYAWAGVDVGTNAQYAEARLITFGDGNPYVVCCGPHPSDSNLYIESQGYAAWVHPGLNWIEFRRSGTFITGVNPSTPYALGDTLRVEHDGAGNVVVSINGSPVITWEDEEPLTETWAHLGTTGGTQTYDDFACGALPAITIYESWAGSDGSPFSTERWMVASGTTGTQNLAGGGKLRLRGGPAGDYDWLDGVPIRSIESFDGEVRWSIEWVSAGLPDVQMAFCVQDTGSMAPSDAYPTNGYYIVLNPSVTATFFLARRISGSGIALAAGSTFTAAGMTAPAQGVVYNFAAHASGGVVRVWAWDEGDERPGMPTFVASDSTYSSGRVRYTIPPQVMASGEVHIGPISYG